MSRPSFADCWARFAEVNVSVAEVGKKIGGKVQANIDSRVFQNACPIRMSYVMNYAGVPIPRTGYAVVSGSDGLWYLYRVNEMMTFLERSFGAPEHSANSPNPSHFFSKKGVIVVTGHGWTNARGHVTLWNGAVCSDSCHLGGDPSNGSFVPETAALWTLS